MHSWGTRGSRFKSGRADCFSNSLGTIWGPHGSLAGSQMGAERLASVQDRTLIGVQVPLRGRERAVPGDLAEDMHRHPCISHPGQPGMTQVMTAQVAVTDLRHYLVPVRRVTQDGCGDPAAARAGEQTCHRIVADGVQPPVYERAYLLDDRHRPGPFAFCALVDQGGPRAARAAATAAYASAPARAPATAGPTPVGWRESKGPSGRDRRKEFQNRSGFDKGTLATARIGLMRAGQ